MIRTFVASLCTTLFVFSTHAEADPGKAASDDIRVVREADMSKFWTPRNPKPPRFSKRILRKHEWACVAVGFVVEPDGTSSTHRILRKEPDDPVLDKSAIAAVKRWLFDPGPLNAAREPVYTTAMFSTFRFGMSPTSEETQQAALAVSKACEVDIDPDAVKSAATPSLKQP